MIVCILAYMIAKIVASLTLTLVPFAVGLIVGYRAYIAYRHYKEKKRRMVHATDLLPCSWLRNEKNFYARVATLLPALYDDSKKERGWLINGQKEEVWSGIPLTPQLLLDSGGGWRLDFENNFQAVYRLPNGFYCAFIKEGNAISPPGTILVNDEYRSIKFVHDLQLQYFAKVGKPLIFDL